MCYHTVNVQQCHGDLVAAKIIIIGFVAIIFSALMLYLHIKKSNVAEAVIVTVPESCEL